MEVQLGDYTLEASITRKNNKNIYFRFKEDNILYVTCSYFVSDREIKKVIKDNEKSLLKLYLKDRVKMENSKIFHYLGKPYTVVYDSSLSKTCVSDGFIYTKDSKMFNKWYKDECKRVFSERINALIDGFSNIPPFSLRIRKMSTRWGVNNVTKSIITLNSLLIERDVTLIDYVIVHELCHFYEANHSSRFWYQVGLRYPNYKEARKRLRVE